eukprot:2592246-Amphidinium_carterae.1
MERHAGSIKHIKDECGTIDRLVANFAIMTKLCVLLSGIKSDICEHWSLHGLAARVRHTFVVYCGYCLLAQKRVVSDCKGVVKALQAIQSGRRQPKRRHRDLKVRARSALPRACQLHWVKAH